MKNDENPDLVVKNDMISKSAKSATYRIWIGGDYDAAVQACRNYVMRGLCVSVQRADYVFTMGMESGVCVTVINYPRFPLDAKDIEKHAIDLGGLLCAELYQGSFSVEGPDETHWFSRRPGDMEEEKA